MKPKTLIIFLALAVIIGALAWYSTQKKSSSAATAVLGHKIMPNLAVNRVAKLMIASKNGLTTLAKPRDKWVVANRFNYPAKFEKIADTIRELSELKIGQTVNADPARLGALNLLPPAPGDTNQAVGTGTRLELRDEKDGLLASLLIGKGFTRQPGQAAPEMMFAFSGYSDGQYVRTVDGKTYLVSRNLERLIEETKTWLADDFINAPASDIREIETSGPERAPLTLTKAKDADPFTLAGLQPESTLDNSKLTQITGALDHLGFDDVADPNLSLKETGLDRPVVFKAVTKDGMIYTLRIGNALTNDTFDRYCALSVTNAPLPAKQADETATSEHNKPELESKNNIAEQAGALNQKFAPWIYIIKSYRTEPLLLKREDLIKKPEAPKADGASADAPAVKTEEKKSKPEKNTKPASKKVEIRN